MIKIVSAVAALFLATAILLTGNGLQGTLLAVRGGLEGFSTSLIGALMAAYYAGFIIGCRVNPGFIRSVGHIRTFTALASIASAAALIHPFFVNEAVWAVLRVVTGFCFAGLFMVIESWLNERATNQDRGRILSVYRIVDLTALVAGNALLAAAEPGGFELFALTSIFISLALVPVALTRSPAPQPIDVARLDIGRLFRVSPVAAIGAPAVGLANAAFWGVGPVFALQIGYDKTAIAGFMSAVILGGALMQWPLGLLSDKFDRRLVMTGSSLFGAAASFALASFAANGEIYLYACGAVFGAFVLPMFGLNAAHANDHAPPGRSVETNGGLLMLHGAGAVAGAGFGGVIMTVFGPTALFDYIASVYLVFAAFCLYRIFSRRAPTGAEKPPVTPVPRSAAPTVFEIGEDDAAPAADEETAPA